METTMQGPVLFSIRISLPDRPGALGALASSLGAAGGNILSLDVIERGDGFAVDQLAVEIPAGGVEKLRAAAESVPGVLVEDVRRIPEVPDTVQPIALAAALAENPPGEALATLVDHLPRVFVATWAAAIMRGPHGTEVIAASAGCPPLGTLATPWLPLDGAKRLGPARWMPPGWRNGLLASMGLRVVEIAAAPLFDPRSAVLVMRRIGPRWRASELRQLACLARVAAAVVPEEARAARIDVPAGA